MFNQKTLIFLLAMALIVQSFVLFKTCSREPKTIETTTVDTIPGDSIHNEVIVDKPMPKYIDTGGWYYYQIDTMAILKDYLSRVVYIDTLMDDSSAFISIIDTVQRNRLQGRKLLYANRKPTAVIHNTTVLPRARESPALYAGAMAAVMPDKVSIGPAVLLTLPKGYSYSYAYGINTKTHILTFVYKIRLKRKVLE